jgi:16S rRNA (guanine1207-N2)-methyltransferase
MRGFFGISADRPAAKAAACRSTPCFPASHAAVLLRIFRRVSPALETLLLPFSRGEIEIPQRALFLGAEPHPDLREWPAVTGWQPFFPLAEAWRKAGFPLTDEPAGSWPLVLLLPGKSKEEVLASFARAYDSLEEGGMLVVGMANTAGAARFEKEFAAASGGVASLQKNKCRAFHAAKSAAWNQALLAEWRELGKPRTLESTGFIVEAGIFSADHVDPGSALLAEHLPKNLKGAAADLGAGWGFLSRELLGKSPNLKSLDLFEADARALACAKKNLSGIATPLEFHWHDVAAGLPGKYEVIVMNPPFHTGQNTDISLGRAFLRSAADAMRTGGRLFMVANRQLPYEAELDALGLVWRKPVEDSTYKLLFAEKRLGPSKPVTFR